MPPTQKLDLFDNDFLLDYAGTSPYQTMRDYSKIGHDTGTGGITSTASEARSSRDTILAIIDNAQFGRTSWNGEAIDSTTIIGKYTYFGDSNLDGKVTGDDYVAIDSNLGRTNAQWFHGDFNFDSIVAGEDYGAIDGNLGKGIGDPL